MRTAPTIPMPDRAAAFLALHRLGDPLLMPNPWDLGSARMLTNLGFQALATTSSGFAATLGRLDGSVTRQEAITHAGQIASASELPVSADLENGFGHGPDQVALTVAAALEAGLAGCSIEDYTGDKEEPIYPLERAVERVRRAAQVAHDGPRRLVLTARAEGHLHGRDDLGETIARLQQYAAAGADVVFAPGVIDTEQIRLVVAEVGKPVNVLALQGTPSVQELADLGVARISVGGAFAFAALAGLVDAATELRDEGTYGYLARSAAGRASAGKAFED